MKKHLPQREGVLKTAQLRSVHHLNTIHQAYQISSNRRALALCGIGIYPATLKTTLCR